MTKPVLLPTHAEIVAVIKLCESESPTHPPSALSVAARLGLSNATFWRHFPQIAQDLADARRDSRKRVTTALKETARSSQTGDLRRIRDDRARVENDLKVAAAEIQRLTLENHRLRTSLEQATGILPFKKPTET